MIFQDFDSLEQALGRKVDRQPQVMDFIRELVDEVVRLRAFIVTVANKAPAADAKEEE